MTPDQVPDYANKISALLTERFAVKGASLDQQLRRAGRRLPRAVKRDLRRIVEANALIGHPKLARTLDMRQVGRACDNVLQFLRSRNPVAERREKWGERLGIASGFVVVLAFVALFLWWVLGLVEGLQGAL